VPSGITATNGNRLKLATAVGATGTQTFAADASTSYVASAVAANATFAQAGTRFEISPLLQAAAATQSATLSGAATFRVFVDNGTTGAGTAISVPSGSQQIVVRISYWEPADVLSAVQVGGVRPARQLVP
jgi:hypothetical protein